METDGKFNGSKALSGPDSASDSNMSEESEGGSRLVMTCKGIASMSTRWEGRFPLAGRVGP